MSWFGTADFASLAKSALKEAQKTFDKALDLEPVAEKDDETSGKDKSESDSFFSAFGLGTLSGSGEASSSAERGSTSSMWGSLGASLLREHRSGESAAVVDGQPGSADPGAGPGAVTSPPNGLSGLGAPMPAEPGWAPEDEAELGGGWESAAPPAPDAAAADLSALLVDSPAADGFQRSVLVVAGAGGDWAGEPAASPPAAATPDSIEVLEASGERGATPSDADAPAESLHSSNSSCHTLVSAEAAGGGAAAAGGRAADSPGDSSSSESFLRLGAGLTPLTSPDAPLMSPDVALMSASAGRLESPPDSSVELLASPAADSIEPAGGSAERLLASPANGSVEPISSGSVSVGLVSPASDSVGPASDSVGPASDSVGPASDSVGPVSDSVGPVSDSMGPTSDSVGPTSDSVGPTSDSVGPVSESVGPVSSGSGSAEAPPPPAGGDAADRPPRPDSCSPPRETSAEPSTSSADVCLGGGRGLSPHESGHTSADEIETATSSDIEVLASPLAETRHLAAPAGRRRPLVGAAPERSETPSSDGSHPPPAAAGKETGHRRNLSQTSLASSDLEPECERWARRAAELQEVLTAREAKMMELSRLNVTLQEDNSNMHSRLELLEAQLAHSSASGGASEKQLQQLTAERDALQKQLLEARRRGSELEEAVRERDTVVEELRAEGEKLSREQLKLSTVIKRLRAKEKEQEAAAKKQEEKVTRLTADVTSLTEQLTSLTEADREHGRTHKQLSGQVARLEREAAEARLEAEEARSAAAALEAKLQAAQREVSELERRGREQDSEAASLALSAEIQAKQELERSLAEYRSAVTREQDDLLAQIEDLRLSVRRAERESARHEDAYKSETAELQRRLLESERRNQQLGESVTMATRPLLHQLETLQAALSTQQQSWERAERALTEKNGELQRQLAAVSERERHVTEQYVEASSRQAPLEAALTELRAERRQLTERLQSAELRLAEAAAAADRARSERAASERELHARLEEVRTDKEALERQLETEQAALLAERARNAALHQQTRERGRQLSHSQSAVESTVSQLSTPRTSPTPSLSRISFSSSFHELDGVLEPATPRGLSLYDTVRAGQGAATVVESLTSQLKQREGELNQLRGERAELESARQQLSAELARVTGQLEEAAAAGQQLQLQTERYQQLESTYNALLQMYGEKAEESEELKLDLADVKEMYKQQIDQLTKRS